MLDDDLMTHLPILLRPDPARVVIRPFVPAEDSPSFASNDRPRAQRIADRVLALDDDGLRAELARVSASLKERHRDVEHLLQRRFHEVNGLLIDHCSIRDEQSLLIGAYFSEEFAFEAAALFNPSIVVHPDQSCVQAGALRFVLSLRGAVKVLVVNLSHGTFFPEKILVC